jgi:serine/threonine protein kinase/formylglycine-generating enzyme required for sulfatase activity
LLCFRCGSYNQEGSTACSVCGQAFVGEKSERKKPPRKSKVTASVFGPGEMVGGKYRIVELLGQGGVGTVYRARDTEIDVDVALKAIAPNLLQTEEERKLFSKMIKQARKLHHPNIIRIYDEGHEGNKRFFTMKMLEGLTLRKIIRLRHDKGQAFTPDEIVPIFHQLAAALDYAHKTTWHGDLKPENVIILPDLLKVTDFGLVKGLPLKPFLGIAKSRSQGFHYIAPELRVESSHIDGRCDVYSLGVVLAEMLTGLQYEGHFTRALTAALEQLPTKLDGLVRKALSEHPDARFGKAGTLAKELESALEKVSGELPKPAGEPVRAKPRKLPPPPPAETNPGEVPDDVSDHGESLEEIGQSQVVMIDGTASGDETLNQSAISTSERDQEQPKSVSTDAQKSKAKKKKKKKSKKKGTKRRDERASDVVKAMRPPPLDEPPPDGPKVDDSKRDRPPLPDAQLVDEAYDSASADGLVPPPLPDGEVDEDALDASASFDDGISLRSTGSQEGAGQDGPSLDRPEHLKDDSVEETTLPDMEDVGIHEELTALKPHPRPDLRDAPALVSRDDIQPSDQEVVDERLASLDHDPAEDETLSRALPDKVSEEERAEEDEPPETASADEVEQAIERSSPRLHAAERLAPPVVSPAQSQEAFVPPAMRRVTPPEPQRKGGGGIWAVALLALVVVVGVMWAAGRGETSDEKVARADAGALAPTAPEPTPAPPPVEVPSPPPPVEEPTPAPVEEPAPIEPAVDEEEQRRLREQMEHLATMEKLKAEQAAREEAKRKQWEDEKRRLDEQRRAEESDLAERREAERAAELARKRAEEEEARRRAEEKKRDEEKKLAAAAATPARDGKCPPGMVKIPGATFLLGSKSSDPMRNFGEKLATRVEVQTYCIDYFEFPNSKRRKPTVGVSWTAAKRACEKKGRRLCTEAEWERACKGPKNRRFAYGNRFDVDRCNTEDSSGQPRSLEGANEFKKCRSGFNVFAMSGNAEEWVADNFRSGASSKTAKGGAADRPDWASRCAARRGLSAGTKKKTLGFRCCADPE